MDPTRLMRQPATWTSLRPSSTGRDDDGNPTVVTTSTSLSVWVAPTSSSEDLDGQNRQTGLFTGYLPPTAAVAGSDRLVVAGVTYEATGPSEPWVHPRTADVRYRTVPLRVVA